MACRKVASELCFAGEDTLVRLTLATCPSNVFSVRTYFMGGPLYNMSEISLALMYEVI